jgi:uncharacterized protein (TIGR02996 family)
MDRAAFEAITRQNPNDTNAHLVYADWLDEHGFTDEAADHRRFANDLQNGHYRFDDRGLRRYSVVTVPRGSWQWQNAFGVRINRPIRTRRGRWVWQTVGTLVSKASKPQLRSSWGHLPVGGFHNTPLTSAEIAAHEGQLARVASQDSVETGPDDIDHNAAQLGRLASPVRYSSPADDKVRVTLFLKKLRGHRAAQAAYAARQRSADPAVNAKKIADLAAKSGGRVNRRQVLMGLKLDVPSLNAAADHGTKNNLFTSHASAAHPNGGGPKTTWYVVPDRKGRRGDLRRYAGEFWVESTTPKRIGRDDRGRLGVVHHEAIDPSLARPTLEGNADAAHALLTGQSPHVPPSIIRSGQGDVALSGNLPFHREQNAVRQALKSLGEIPSGRGGANAINHLVAYATRVARKHVEENPDEFHASVYRDQLAPHLDGAWTSPDAIPNAAFTLAQILDLYRHNDPRWEQTPVPSFYSHFQANACHFHRLFLPARFMRQDFPGCRIVSTTNDPPGEFDVYALHGLQPLTSFGAAGAWLYKGGRFIWSVDDDWKTVPDWNPAKPGDEQMWSYANALRLAEWVLCSTPHLATTFPEQTKTVVAPNMLDLSPAYYPHSTPAVEDGGPIRVLWAGSVTHREDVKQIAAGVDRVMRELGPARVQFYFLGMAPPDDLFLDHLHKGVIHRPTVAFEHYWNQIAGIRPHVVLAPMYECDFNLSKSNLRILEGWAQAAAVIASPVGEYRVVRDGEDGLVAANDDQWADAIYHAVTDPDLRYRLAAAGRKRVERDFNWDRWECRGEWREAFAKMLGVPLPERQAVAA